MAESCSSSSTLPPEEPSQHLLEELCAKFILTAPKDGLSKDRIFFLVEQAWWYYEDKVRPISKTPLKHYSSYTTFAEPLFRKCEALNHLLPELPTMLENYRRYKQSIPVYGAILLDAAMEQVLLVRGNKSSMGWGFPRGKVNEGESEACCAIREVLEETGYDIKASLRESDYLEVTADGKRHKLYIVTGLDPETQEFEPHSKYEIGAYAWHRVDALPASADEASQVYMSADGVRHRFFMIHPFVARLRKWIEKRRKQLAAQRQQQQQQPAGVTGPPPGLSLPPGLQPRPQQPQPQQPQLQQPQPQPQQPQPERRTELSGHSSASLSHLAISGTPTLLTRPQGQPQQQQQQQPVQLQGQAASGGSQAASWAPSMRDFRFNREPILRCFTTAVA